MLPSGVHVAAAALSAAVLSAASPSSHKFAAATTFCHQIDAQPFGQIAYPGQPEYVDSQSTYYTSNERSVAPACVFRPNSTADVARIIKSLSHASQGPGAPQFAVRSGGHMFFEGAANSQNGVTIDMRSINSLSLSADKSVASIGGGTAFSDLYPELDSNNVTILGARVPGVAAGGFLTGGGLNFLGRKHGWGCDNIYGYEVVLASGEVVYASASSHPDLWLALKGGSSNFGIVTRFDIAAYEIAEIWAGVIAFPYSTETIRAQASGFHDFMAPENFDPAAAMDLILYYAGGNLSVENALYYTEPIANPKIFHPFTSMAGAVENTVAFKSVSAMTTELGTTLPPSVIRSFQLTYSFHNPSVEQFGQIFDSFTNAITALSDVAGLQVQFLLQPLPVTNGTNSFGQIPGQTDLVLSNLGAAWSSTDDDAAVRATLTAIMNAHEKMLQAAGLSIPFKYLNYADISQDVIASYGAASQANLKAVSKKYDPRGLFQYSMPGGYKLFK